MFHVKHFYASNFRNFIGLDLARRFPTCYNEVHMRPDTNPGKPFSEDLFQNTEAARVIHTQDFEAHPV